MTREIKFRAWLPDFEKMVYSNNQASLECCEIWDIGNTINIHVQENYWTTENGEPVEKVKYTPTDSFIMQYIGLKDKNGKEIYEGDIVEYKLSDAFDYSADLDYNKQYDTPQRSEFAWSYKYCGFRLLAFSRFTITCAQMEVVGNIYEHPLKSQHFVS